MDLHITAQEQELLADVLRHCQRELLLEISHASHQEFKAGLRQREGLLEELLDKLAPAEAGAKRAS